MAIISFCWWIIFDKYVLSHLKDVNKNIKPLSILKEENPIPCNINDVIIIPKVPNTYLVSLLTSTTTSLYKLKDTGLCSSTTRKGYVSYNPVTNQYNLVCLWGKVTPKLCALPGIYNCKYLFNKVVYQVKK